MIYWSAPKLVPPKTHYTYFTKIALSPNNLHSKQKNGINRREVATSRVTSAGSLNIRCKHRHDRGSGGGTAGVGNTIGGPNIDIENCKMS